MKLIGVNIFSESKEIMKVLKPGWFPFGNYPAPAGDKKIPCSSFPKEIEDIYSLDSGVKISVAAIVGKNGSGKSTLLDIIYRIINNFSIHCIGIGKSQSKYRHLNFVYGVYADLYYQLGNIQYRIICRNTDVRFEKTVNGVFRNIVFSMTRSNKARLYDFFYTIATNYSLYSYDKDDYLSERHPDIPEDKDNGKWIDGLFHKNDGYLTPIVLTPFREDGSIQAKREKHLAEQRINAMALMAASHDCDFLPGYQVWNLSTSLVPDFEKERRLSLQKSIDNHSSWMNASLMIDEFQEAWNNLIKEKLVKEKLGTFNTGGQRHRFKLALFYLAYKSIKLAMTYEDYARIFHLASDNKKFLDPSDQREYYQHILKNRAKALINKIYDEISANGEEHNHLILKIEQTWEDIKYLAKNSNPKWSAQSDKDVLAVIKKNEIHTYSDLVKLLPPPYYKVTLTFRKRRDTEKNRYGGNWSSFGKNDTITLASMSSGERHLLYALSYVLYHIKNLQSVKKDVNRIKYRNICLVFDEIEMFLHPEYQRRFVSMLIESLQWVKINGEDLKSIQILIATHSPFTLTDIFTHNTLYLKDGMAERVEEESFGANYYDILANSFFFESSAVGEIASRYISDCAKEKDLNRLRKKLSFIGDGLLSNFIYNQTRKLNEAE